MKIHKISILNYLGIGTFKTDRLGKINRIEGGNGVGKSTILKAITEMFKSSGRDLKVIKVDSEKAEIVIELDDNIQAQRIITPTSNTVKVTRDGEPLSKPQAWLDSIFGPLNFNPVDFYQGKPGESNADLKRRRRQMLLSSMPFHLDPVKLQAALEPLVLPLDLHRFDFSAHGLEVLSALKTAVYDRRHEQNLEVVRLKKAIEQDKIDIPETVGAKRLEGVTLESKLREKQVADLAIANHDNDIRRLDLLRSQAQRQSSHIESLKAQLAEAQEELVRIQEQGKTLRTEVDKFIGPDVAAIQSDIDALLQSQKLQGRLEDIARKQKQLELASDEHRQLDAIHKALDGDIPRKLLAQVKLPVKGVEIRGDDIYVNKVSLETMSTSEQMRFAISVAKSLTGTLKVICVDRFESLDRDAQKVFEAEAKDDDFEYFITNVTAGDLSVSTHGPLNGDYAKPVASRQPVGVGVGF